MKVVTSEIIARISNFSLMSEILPFKGMEYFYLKVGMSAVLYSFPFQPTPFSLCCEKSSIYCNKQGSGWIKLCVFHKFYPIRESWHSFSFGHDIFLRSRLISTSDFAKNCDT